MMERLFNQTATWVEVIPPTSSLTAETTESHVLKDVRMSVITDGRSSDGYGWQGADSSTMYYLVGYSACDGSKDIPAFHEGDQIAMGGKTLTIVAVNHVYGIAEGLHHLEVVMR